MERSDSYFTIWYSDRVRYKKLIDLAAALGVTIVNLQWRSYGIRSTVTEVDTETALFDSKKVSDAFTDLLKFDAHALHTLQVQMSDGVVVTTDLESDSLKISISFPPTLANDKIVDCVGKIQAQFPDRITFIPNKKSTNRFFQNRVQQLEVAQEKFVNAVTTYFESVDAARMKWEEERLDILKMAQAEAFRIIGEADQKAKNIIYSVSQKETELQERLKAVNDKESKFERRTIFSTELGKFENNLQKGLFTKASTNKTAPIFVAFFVATFMSGFFAFSSFGELQGLAAQRDQWYAMFVKSILAGGIFFTFMGFFIKWLDTWFRRNLDEESHVRKLRFDLARQNMLTETVMEYRDLAKQDPPETLLDRFSRNLYEDKKSKDESMRLPQERLAEVLMAAKNLRLSGPGWEAELSNKGVSKIGSDQ